MHNPPFFLFQSCQPVSAACIGAACSSRDTTCAATIAANRQKEQHQLPCTTASLMHRSACCMVTIAIIRLECSACSLLEHICLRPSAHLTAVVLLCCRAWAVCYAMVHCLPLTLLLCQGIHSPATGLSTVTARNWIHGKGRILQNTGEAVLRLDGIQHHGICISVGLHVPGVELAAAYNARNSMFALWVNVWWPLSASAAWSTSVQCHAESA